MKVSYQLEEGYRAVVSNGRGHEEYIDLPESAGGKNSGAKAYEHLAMSLVGCVGTIFKNVANKMRLNIEDLRIDMETTDDDTIIAVAYKMYVKSDAPMEKLERCLELTEKTCPVGVLFHKAGVPFTHEIVKM